MTISLPAIASIAREFRDGKILEKQVAEAAKERNQFLPLSPFSPFNAASEIIFS